MAKLKITYKPVADLMPRANNPRTHSETQFKQLMQSITYFGFTNPVLVDCDDRLIAGHGRVDTAKRLGMQDVPRVCLADMSEADMPLSQIYVAWAGSRSLKMALEYLQITLNRHSRIWPEHYNLAYRCIS